MTARNELILANLVANRAQTHPDLDVLTFENDDRPADIRTYQDLWHNGLRICAALRSEGMEQGDYFALLMYNHPEFVEAMVGASLSGTVFVPIDPRTQGDTLVYLLTHAGCKGIICADYTAAAVQEVRDRVPFLRWIWVLDSGPGVAQAITALRGARPLAKILQGPVVLAETVVTDPAEPMEVMYTSGTTGDAKGVIITHARWGSVANWHQALGYRAEDRPYSGLSLTHGNAQLVTLACSLKLGMRAVFSRRFTKSRLWDIVRRHQCTVFSLLGGMSTAIYSEPERADDADNPVRYVISAGMPKDLWLPFERRFGVRVLEFYAAVEGGLAINPVDVGPVGSIGKPTAGLKVRLVDNYGADVPVGSQGEIIFQHEGGQAPLVQYLHDPEASSKKVRGGWLRTGDIGHLDEQGWLFFDFRAGMALRHNGEFINTSRIEKVLVESEMVNEAYVYGVKARSGSPGEKDIVAAIVPARFKGLDVSELFAVCRAGLEANAIPAYLQIVSEIPKTVSEKPMERLLRTAFEDRSDPIYSQIEAMGGLELTPLQAPNAGD